MYSRTSCCATRQQPRTRQGWERGPQLTPEVDGLVTMENRPLWHAWIEERHRRGARPRERAGRRARGRTSLGFITSRVRDHPGQLWPAAGARQSKTGSPCLLFSKPRRIKIRWHKNSEEDPCIENTKHSHSTTWTLQAAEARCGVYWILHRVSPRLSSHLAITTAKNHIICPIESALTLKQEASGIISSYLSF